MTRKAIGLMLVAVLLSPLHTLGSQRDHRLEALFGRLKTAHSNAEAAELTATIWSIWQQSENDQVNALMSEGVQELSQGNYTKALAAFSEVVKTDPEFAEGWNKRATVYYLMREFSASIHDIERTLALEPHHFGALSGLGLIYLALGNDLAALRAFEGALKVNPHLPAARYHAEELRRRLHDRAI